MERDSASRRRKPEEKSQTTSTKDGMVSYTTRADTGEKRIQNLSGLEDNVIYAEQKVTGTDGTASSYQDFLYTKDIRGQHFQHPEQGYKGELSYRV